MDIEDEIYKIVKEGLDSIYEECFDALGDPDWGGGAEETFMEMIRDSIERELDNS